jgi:hypothetical protein
MSNQTRLNQFIDSIQGMNPRKTFYKIQRNGKGSFRTHQPLLLVNQNLDLSLAHNNKTCN